MKRQPTGRAPEPRAGRALTKAAEVRWRRCRGRARVARGAGLGLTRLPLLPQYVGSFAVEDADLPRAGQAVHQRLQLLKVSGEGPAAGRWAGWKGTGNRLPPPRLRPSRPSPPTQDCPRRRSVLLRFCLQGLKMLGRDGEVGRARLRRAGDG